MALILQVCGTVLEQSNTILPKDLLSVGVLMIMLERVTINAVVYEIHYFHSHQRHG